MKIDLTKLTIDFPKKPTQIRKCESERKRWEDYNILGFLDGENVGRIKISLATKFPSSDLHYSFWYDSTKTEVRPVVVYQGTNEEFYGNGICGRLLVLSNEIAKEKFNQPLASDTLFCRSVTTEWEIKSFSERPSMRVWEKLEREGLARREDYRGKARWIMK